METIKKTALILLLNWIIIPFCGYAQKPGLINFNLQKKIHEHEFESRNKPLNANNNSNDIKKIDLLIKANSSKIAQHISSFGGKLKYHYGDICAISINSDQINLLANAAELLGIEKIEYRGEKGLVLNDSMIKNIQAQGIHEGLGLPQAYDGQGVILGFIDTGIDFNHGDFKDEQGKTRIIKIWDQTIVNPSKSPKPYNYGQEWTAADINAGICTHNTSLQGGHGTHVVGISAGNAGANGKYKGIAPKSKIVMVASEFNPANRSWTSTVADGIKYIFDIADSLGQPCVINTSVGTLGGSRDAKDLDAQLIENMVKEKPGRAIVGAVGNYGNSRFHLGYDVSSDTSFTWFERKSGFYFPPYAPNASTGALFFELYADTGDFNGVNFNFGVDKSTPSYFRVAQSSFYNIQNYFNGGYKLDQYGVFSDTIKNSNGNRLASVHIYAENNSGTYLMQVIVFPDSTSGYKWRFSTCGSGKFDIWSSSSLMGSSDMNYITSSPSAASFPEIIKYKNPDANKTLVSSWSCSTEIITVGAYKNRDFYTDVNGITRSVPLSGSLGSIYPSSSLGPTRNNTMKPDICAPGWGVISSGSSTTLLSKSSSSIALGGKHMEMTGTSMASPMVAGIAALYLQKCPKANHSEIKNALLNTSFKDNFTGTNPGNVWGYGKVNGLAMLQSSNYQVNIENQGQSIFCQGDSTILAAPSGYISYLWSNGEKTQKINIKSAGKYHVLVTDANQKQGFSDTLEIFVKSKPEINFSSVLIKQCQGNIFDINAAPSGGTGKFTHTWTGDTSLIVDKKEGIVSIKTDSTGLFHLKYNILDSNACINSDSISIEISPKPSLKLLSDNNACEGDSVSVELKIESGSNPYSVVWDQQMVVLDSVSGIFTADSAGTYQIKLGLLDGKGCSAEDSLEIKFHERPKAKMSSSQKICEGDTAYLSINFSGNGPWNFDLNSGNNIENVSFEDSVFYYSTSKNTILSISKLSDKFCDAILDKDSVKIEINSLPQRPFSDYQLKLCLNDSFLIKLQDQSAVGTWLGDTEIFSNANDSCIQIVANKTGTHILTYTTVDSNSCKRYDTLLVQINELPIIIKDKNYFGCQSDTINIKLNSEKGKSPYQYHINNDNNILHAVNSETYLFSTENAGQYSYLATVSDSNLCSNFDSIKITVSEKPQIIYQANASICSGDSSLISMEFKGSAPWILSYKENESIKQDTIFNESLNYYTKEKTILHFTKLEDQNCVSDYLVDSLFIDVLPIPEITLKVSKSNICIGERTYLKAFISGGSGNYEKPIWQSILGNILPLSDDSIEFFSEKEGFYEISFDIADKNGCLAKKSTVIHVNPNPDFELQASYSICAGDSLEMNKTLTKESNNTNKIWSGNPNYLFVKDSISIFCSIESGNYSYQLKIADSLGCLASDSIQLKVLPLPKISILEGKAFCPGDSSKVTLSFKGQAPWQIYFSENQIEKSDTFNTENHSLYFNQTTTFKIHSITDANCEVKNMNEELNIMEFEKPIMNFTDTFLSSCQNNDVIIKLNTNMNAEKIMNQEWQGDGGKIFQDIDSHWIFKADSAGIYNIKLNTIDTNSCITQDSLIIKINTIPEILLFANNNTCLGDTVFISAQIKNGNSPYTCLWDKNNTDSLVLNQSIYPFQSNQNGNHQINLLVIDDEKCIAEDSIEISVHELPQVRIEGAGKICQGDSLLVTLQFSGNSPWYYHYTFDNQNFENKSSENKTSLFFKKENVFKITSLNDSFCYNKSALDSTFIDVIELPKSHLSLKYKEICLGDSAALMIESLMPDYTISWEADAQFMNFISDTLVYFKPKQTGSYQVKVNISDSLGCNINDSSTIVLNENIQVQLNDVEKICHGDSIKLLAETIGGLAPYNFSWIIDSAKTLLSEKNFIEFKANNTGNTFYSVMVYDQKGCNAKDSINVVVNPLPNAFFSDDAIICPGDSAKINIQLDGLNPFIINYTNGEEQYHDTLNSSEMMLFSKSNSTYKIINLRDANCINKQIQDSTQIAISELPAFAELSSNSDSVCLGDNFSLNVVNPQNNIIYNIYNSDTSKTPLGICPLTIYPFNSQSYFIEAVNSIGCIQKEQRTKFYLHLTSFSEVPDISPSITYCYEDSIKPIIAQAKSGGLIYWYSDDSLKNFLDTGNYYYPQKKLGISNYYVIEKANGCSGSINNTSIEVFPNPEKPVITVNINELSTTSIANAYQWYVNNNPIKDALFKNYNADKNGTYKLIITNENGCQAISDTLNFNYTGFSKLNKENNPFIYPNPSNGQFYLSVPKIRSNNCLVEILDIHGKTVKKIEIEKIQDNINLPLDLREYPKGIYLIRLEDGLEINTLTIILN